MGLDIHEHMVQVGLPLGTWVMCMAEWTLLLFQKLHEVQYLSHGRLGQLLKMLVDKLSVGHD